MHSFRCVVEHYYCSDSICVNRTELSSPGDCPSFLHYDLSHLLHHLVHLSPIPITFRLQNLGSAFPNSAPGFCVWITANLRLLVLTMAAAERPSANAIYEDPNAASEIPGIPLHDYQPLQSTLPSSDHTERIQADQHTAEDVPAKSLFGPFPIPAEASDDGQRDITSVGTGNMPAPGSATNTDSIEYSKGNGRTGTNPPSPLNFDPQNREPLKLVHANKPPTPDATAPPPLTREKTAPAIGPATDKPTPVPKESEIEGPVLFITLLLSSTGARHPYKLDEKYLRKRNVTVEGNNPINISLYKLKELILRDWREGKDKTQSTT